MDSILPIIVLLALGVPALVVQAITKSAAQGRTGRNAVAGIRIKPVTDSDEAWIAGHQAALPIINALTLAQIVLVVVSIVFFFMGKEQVVSTMLLIIPVVLLGFTAWATVKARAAAQATLETT
ncbi:hypothetical protein [Corynebacterium aquilae]|uniref:hypothetical protein n=1 Tax=Corynebacterium aquilae TaxID=203263 RepID=UPI000951F295|nr:hypothetical protein [Corynebacterium aquilae]